MLPLSAVIGSYVLLSRAKGRKQEDCNGRPLLCNFTPKLITRLYLFLMLWSFKSGTSHLYKHSYWTISVNEVFFSTDLLAGSLRDKLDQMWFTLYKRKHDRSSSGFEHVFVGELDGEVSGFHNWVNFQKEEDQGKLNYYGWMDSKKLGAKVSMFSLTWAGNKYSWKGNVTYIVQNDKKLKIWCPNMTRCSFTE